MPVLFQQTLHLLHSPETGIHPEGLGPGLLKYGCGLAAHQRVVIHHQHGQALKQLPFLSLALHLLVILRQFKGQCDRKYGSLFFLTFHLNAAAHELDQIIYNGKTQTASNVVAGCFRRLLFKRHEQAAAELPGHPDSCILHLEPQIGKSIGPLLLLNLNLNPSSCPREFQRIGQQVHENLFQAQRISYIKLLQRLAVVNHILNLPLFRLGIYNLIHLVHQLRKIKVFVGQLHFPGLNLRHIQDIINQGEQVPGGGVNFAEAILDASSVI